MSRPVVPPLDPCIAATIYPAGAKTRAANTMSAMARASRPIVESLLQEAAPGDLAVCIHDPINGDERPLVELVRALDLRLWVAWGANPHVATARAHGVAAAVAVAERWARAAADIGAEVIELNGERSGSNNPKDWVVDAGGDAELLPVLGRELVAACRRAAPGVRVSFTSHGQIRYHRVPVAAFLGPDGVDDHAPQLYGADPLTPRLETHRDAEAYAAAAEAQWRKLVAAGVVRADLGPGGEGWRPYGQLHSMTAAGVATVLDSADVTRGWALPTRIDSEGWLALLGVLRARRLHGRSAGAIKRYQHAHGLDVDGIVGPATRESMGLAH